MKVLGIDQGPEEEHGVCLYDTVKCAVVFSGVLRTQEVFDAIEARPNRVVIEKMVGMGRAVAQETFETTHNGGRFQERAQSLDLPVFRIPRREVLRDLGVTRRNGKGSDARVRARLVLLHGGPNNPKKRTGAIGYKAAPGPLYGVKSHAWSALALAYIGARRPPYFAEGATSARTR